MMNKYLNIGLLVLFFTCSFKAQSQHVFHRLVDYNTQINGGWSIIQTSDGGYISSGIIYGDYYAMLFVKIDSKGDTTWNKMYDWYLGYGEDGYSIIQLSNNYYSVCGGVPDTVNNDTDTFLFTLNENGDSVTFKIIEGGISDHGFMHKLTPDGGFIIGGSNFDATQTYTNIFLIKTDSQGNVQWQKEYGEANFNDNLKSIDLTPDGGYIVGGDFENPATSSWDLFLLKTDSLGNQQWKKYYGTNYSERKGYAISTSDGGYAIVGYTTYSNGNVDGYIVKTNSSGTKIWEKKYGIPIKVDVFKVIRQLPDSNYIVAGSINDTNFNPSPPHVRLFKLNQTGDTIWTKKYGYYGFHGQYAAISHTYVEDINLCSDGGFIATGYIINNSLPAKNDLWLLKTDSMGNTCVIDTTTYEGCWSYSCYTVSSQITADADTVYLTQGATVQFGTVSNFGTSWQWNFGDTTTSTEQYPQHTYTSTGIKTVQLITSNDYCSDTAYYTITVLNDVSSQMLTERSKNVHFTVFPNPASEQLVVNSYRYSVICNRFVVCNLFGKEILTTELKSEKQQIDISSLKEGVYYYKILSINKLLDSGKLVIIE